MAEREGFEPSVQLSPDAVLAGLWFKPLTHLSKTLVDTFGTTPSIPLTDHLLCLLLYLEQSFIQSGGG